MIDEKLSALAELALLTNVLMELPDDRRAWKTVADRIHLARLAAEDKAVALGSYR